MYFEDVVRNNDEEGKRWGLYWEGRMGLNEVGKYGEVLGLVMRKVEVGVF